MRLALLAFTFLITLASCGGESSTPLRGERWYIALLYETAPTAVEGRDAPYLLLQEEEARFSASVGCNQFSGSYELNGSSLSFGPAASTMMACPPPLDGTEAKLKDLLSQTHSWSIEGELLRLYDENGEKIANLLANLQ